MARAQRSTIKPQATSPLMNGCVNVMTKTGTTFLILDCLQGYRDYFTCPIEIQKEGKLGTIKLTGSSGTFSSEGPGGKVDITFQVEGTTVVNEKSIAVNNAGYISVSSTAWGTLGRPDYAVVVYSLVGGGPPVACPIQVPATIGIHPSDALGVFVVTPQEVGVAFTDVQNVVDQILHSAAQGSFYQGAGWAKA